MARHESPNEEHDAPSKTSYALALLAACFATEASGQPQPATLNCHFGPVSRTWGNTEWNVFSCDDKRTLVIVSEPGSLAAPFYFRLSPGENGYQVTGEGSGNRMATNDAYKELRRLSGADIAALLLATRRR